VGWRVSETSGVCSRNEVHSFAFIFLSLSTFSGDSFFSISSWEATTDQQTAPGDSDNRWPCGCDDSRRHQVHRREDTRELLRREITPGRKASLRLRERISCHPPPSSKGAPITLVAPIQLLSPPVPSHLQLQRLLRIFHLSNCSPSGQGTHQMIFLCPLIVQQALGYTLASQP
jgi:hypothetical protein